MRPCEESQGIFSLCGIRREKRYRTFDEFKNSKREVLLLILLNLREEVSQIGLLGL
jgi:hypothetical protein